MWFRELQGIIVYKFVYGFFVVLEPKQGLF